MIIWMLLVSLVAQAEEAVYVNKDDKVPFSGYLLSPDKANKVRLLQIDLSTQNRVNQLLTDENHIMSDRFDAAKQQSEFLSKQLADQRSDGFFNKVGFFVLGCVLTGAVAYGVTRTLR